MSRTTAFGRRAGAVTLAIAMAGAVAPAAHAEEVRATPTAQDTAQLSETADRYLQKRADAVTVTGAVQRRALSAPQNVTGELAGVIEEDFAALADQGRVLKEVNGGYTRAEVDVTVDSTTVAGDTATVEVTEDTRLYYPDVQPDEPEYEEYSLPHTLTYTRAADGGWLLADDKAKVDPTGPAPTTQITEPIDAPAPDSEDEGPKEAATQTPPPADGVTATPRAANYSKMAAYADRHWKNTNSDYRVYDNDCTNFISQAMRAGGWGKTSGSAASRKGQPQVVLRQLHVDHELHLGGCGKLVLVRDQALQANVSPHERLAPRPG
ncbi:amidase domain-containing protein [Streptomyces sp. CB03238]|uniref:amidase domain-containing protein n=1 Tax=Streptomyces sp. CB03238 TaxID=1907777 RepID=UPI0015C4C333|nr:amidase domain-containing protein [Streptomyces sp. CB03238]